MASSGVIKSVTSDVKAIDVDGKGRLLHVGDTVLLNETIITGNAGAVSIWFADGTKLGLEQNSNTLLNDDYFNQGLAESLKSPISSAAEDEVAAIQQAIAKDESFDPSKLEAPAAGGEAGEVGGGGSHSAIEIDYLNPQMTPDSGFNTVGINSGDQVFLDLTSQELILQPGINNIIDDSDATGPIDSGPAVQITDHNGLGIGDNEIVEGSTTAVTGDFVLSASEGVSFITVGGVVISEADLLASGSLAVDITTADGAVLSIDGFDPATGTVNYSYVPEVGAQDHSAGDESIVDQFDITVTDDNNVTSNTAVLDILILDTVPEAIDNFETLSQNQEQLIDNVITNARNDGDNAADDSVGVDGAKLQTVSFAGDTKSFLNAGDLIDISGDDFIQFDTGNGSLYIQDTGQYWYQNTTIGGQVETTDTFGYQLIDGDGDLSAANLTITQVLGDTNSGEIFI